MIYTKIENFLKNILENKNQENINNVNIHNTKIENLGEVILPDPQYGDFKLSVMPFENTGKWVSLPEGFKIWEDSFNKILNKIPLQEGANTHYVTIDTKFFTKEEFLRREGVHADGNFCVDPNFVSLNEKFRNAIHRFKSSWGGASPKPTWGGAKINDDEEDFEFKASWGGASPKPTWGGAKIKDKYVVKEDNTVSIPPFFSEI